MQALAYTAPARKRPQKQPCLQAHAHARARTCTHPHTHAARTHASSLARSRTRSDAGTHEQVVGPSKQIADRMEMQPGKRVVPQPGMTIPFYWQVSSLSLSPLLPRSLCTLSLSSLSLSHSLTHSYIHTHTHTHTHVQEGIEYDMNRRNSFQMDEVVAIRRTDGDIKFGVINKVSPGREGNVYDVQVALAYQRVQADRQTEGQKVCARVCNRIYIRLGGHWRELPGQQIRRWHLQNSL